MAHPYATFAAFSARLGTLGGPSLAQFNTNDNAEDIFAAWLEDISNELDALLAKKYVVPFNAINDSTPTPGIVTTMALKLTIARLLQFRGMSDQAASVEAEVKGILDAILDGDASIPGATPVDPAAGKNIVSYSAGKPVFAGRVNDGVDNTSDTNRWD